MLLILTLVAVGGLLAVQEQVLDPREDRLDILVVRRVRALHLRFDAAGGPAILVLLVLVELGRALLDDLVVMLLVLRERVEAEHG